MGIRRGILARSSIADPKRQLPGIPPRRPRRMAQPGNLHARKLANHHQSRPLRRRQAPRRRMDALDRIVGVRRDKGMAVARYILGTTGIPGISWASGSIQSPPPYAIDLLTGRKLQWWHDRIASYDNEPGMRFAVRYDNGMGPITSAWVGMNITAFTELLAAHHQSTDRGTGKE